MTSGLLASAMIVGALVAARALPRTRMAPSTGIALSLSVVGARALLALGGALSLLHFVPGTRPFRAATDWCVHAVVPFVSTHLGFNGHRFGEIATLIPAVMLLLSLALASLALRRAASGLADWLRTGALGSGPGESVLVGGDEVVVAAAGLRSPKVVVSAGALALLDEAELEAGLAHEQAHIGRRHSYMFLTAALLHPLGRIIPGSRRAMDDLHFHLERDADEHAVALEGDPLALAAAICKAGRSSVASTPVFAGLAGHAVGIRVRLLLDRRFAVPSPAVSAFAAGLILALAIGTLFVSLLAEKMVGTDLGLLVGSGSLPFCPA